MNVFRWVAEEWHRVMIGLIALDTLYDRLQKWDWLEKYVERRITDRRKPDMKFIDSILKYIEGLFEEHAPKIVAAASTPAAQAITAAAVTAAIQQAEQNPKVQAGIAVYQAVKNYNAVASVTATAPQAPSTPPAALKEL